MRTSITGLRGAYFFLCAAFCVVPDGVECSSHLKCAYLKLNQKVLCELGLLWEQCVVSASQQHSNNSSVCRIELLILSFRLVCLFRLVYVSSDKKSCVFERIIHDIK